MCTIGECLRTHSGHSLNGFIALSSGSVLAFIFLFLFFSYGVYEPFVVAAAKCAHSKVSALPSSAVKLISDLRKTFWRRESHALILYTIDSLKESFRHDNTLLELYRSNYVCLPFKIPLWQSHCALIDRLIPSFLWWRCMGYNAGLKGPSTLRRIANSAVGPGCARQRPASIPLLVVLEEERERRGEMAEK